MRIRVYVAAVFATAFAFSLCVYRLEPNVSMLQFRAAIVFAVLSAVSEMAAYTKAGGNESGSISFLPNLALVIIVPTWISIIAIALANVVVQFLKKRVAIKAIFNVAQVALGIGSAIIVYRALGGKSMLAGASPYIPAFVGILGVFAVLNSAAVAGAIAISENQRFWRMWWSRARVTVLFDLFTLPFVYAFAYSYVHWGPVSAFALAIPSFGIRSLYKVNWELEKTNQELLQLMVAAIEARDPYTSGHSRRVSRNSRLIAQAIGLRDKQVERVAVAALLHDVGKIHEIFAPILSKPGRLTAEENAIMQTHPIKSEELVRTVTQLKDVVSPIRHHHENWDGTGYPDGLVGEAIPIASRIIMFADTIDAMTTDRPYRAALTETQVRAEFVKLRGRQFDPAFCDVLLSSPIYPKLFDQDVPLTPAIAGQERRRTTPTPALAS
jgi:HD-GYP domain-containing protein (c-di-GMP phosphodiesterase class II)